MTLLDAGDQISCLSMLTDISELNRAERLPAFLGEVSDVLATSLHYDETIHQVCRLTVPIFADFSQIYLNDGVGHLQRLAVAHADEDLDALARGLVRRFPLELSGESPTAHAGQYLGGMGLGLYISRQIVDLHGGSLEAEFPESGGTRFVVRLPTTS